MYEFKSKLSKYIKDFIELKHNLGYSYKTQEQLLKILDKICLEEFSECEILTKEIYERWMCYGSNSEKPETKNKRISVMRELAKFIRLKRKDCFMPPDDSFVRKIKFTPNIISIDNTEKFFYELDSLKSKNGEQFEVSMSVIFRLLYGTGMRPGEPCRLLLKDVDFNENKIFINESKGHRNRIVPLSEELANILKKYNSYISNDKRQFFFVYDNDKQIKTSMMAKVMHKVWDIAKLPQPSPRVYDWRHTFVSNRLLLWQQNSENVYLNTRYLSIFVGHESFEDTYYYFSLTPELFSTYKSAFDR